MATFDAGLGSAYILRLVVTEITPNSGDIAANQSRCSWSLTIIKGTGTGKWSTGTKYWSANIGGVAYSGSISGYDFRTYSSLLLASGTATINHDPDGSKTISVSGSFDDTISPTFGSGTASGSMALTTIPRATQPTVSPVSGNTGSSYTIGVNPAVSTFYHDIDYSIDGGSTWTNIVTNLPGTTITQSWTPASSLFPNSTTGTAIIRATTKQTSGGTSIGTATVSLPLTVPSSVKPTISSVAWVDTQTSSPDIPTLMGGTGRYVQGWSKLKPTVSSAGASGSTVVSASVTQNAQVTPSGTAFASAVALSGSVPFSAVAIDTRGVSSDPFTGTVAVTPYAFPNLPTPLVQRTSDAAGLIPATSGTYIAITPAASVSSLLFSSSQKNDLEYQIRIKPAGGAYTTVQAWTSASGVTWTAKRVFSGYSSSTEYVVEVSIRDVFGKNGFNTANTVKALTVSVPTESVLLDYNRGDGIGVGKYHTNGMLDVSGDIYQGGNKVVDLSLTASTARAGIQQNATDAETITGTATDRTVTPHGFAAALTAGQAAYAGDRGAYNAMINARFRTNQASYVSGTALAAGAFAVDQWRDARVTNLCANPSIETNTTGWAGSSASPTLASSGTQSKYGTKSLSLTSTTATSTISCSYTPTTVIGHTYTVSAWMLSATGRTAFIDINGQGTVLAGNGTSGTAATLPAGVWTRVWMTYVATAASQPIYPTFLGGPVTIGQVVYVDAVLITEGGILYDYFDGAVTDCSWSSAANASISYSAPNVAASLTFTADSHGQAVTLGVNHRIQQLIERGDVAAGSWTLSATLTGTVAMRAYNATVAPGSRPAFVAGTFTATFDGLADVIVEATGGASGGAIDKVKFEPGTVATAFEPETISDELRRCQRHYYRHTSVTGSEFFATGGIYAGTPQFNGDFLLPVPMRAIPFLESSTASGFTANEPGKATTAATSIGNNLSGPSTTSIYIQVLLGSAAGYVDGGWARLQSVSAGAYLGADARLR